MPSGPKTNKYHNRHAAEAQARDEERRQTAKARQEKEREDAAWAVTDPKEAKRLEKEREAAAKANERAEREAEKRAQLAEEEREATKGAPKKVTKRQLQKDLSKMLADYDKQQQAIRGSAHGASVEQPPLPEGGNPNRNRNNNNNNSDGPEEITASGKMNDVVRQLERQEKGLDPAGDVPDDRHIGKRARVAYKAFYEEQLPAVKEERPGLRRTQYNDVIWEMWQKSPQNPFVRRNAKRNEERLARERRWMEGDDSDGEPTPLSSDKEE